MKMILLVFGLCFSFFQMGLARAEESVEAKWANETEASVVRLNGNTKSESYSLKQKSEVTFGLNKVAANGRYVATKAASVETGRAWDAALRFERALSEQWSLFLEQGAESDVFAGYVQRDHTDFGAKYFFVKTADQNLFAEGGARRTRVVPTGLAAPEENTSGRLYAEWNGNITETVSGKFWTEYLPNSKDADAYRVNYEPSVSVMMSKIFSMKMSYLVKYQNKVATGAEKEDSTLTTSIVAKF